jgi:prepilin-type N-terminal cleavage/methylation domain-containing protein
VDTDPGFYGRRVVPVLGDFEMNRAFTLLELLVVLVIILIVSAIALPVVLPALAHRQASESARIFQAQLAGARDAAIRDNAPSGIRLLPDPTMISFLPNGQVDPSKPLAYNRMIPISQAPNYSEGQIMVWPSGPLPSAVAALPYSGPGTSATPNPTWGQTSALMFYQALTDSTGQPLSPTYWFWNVRVGDEIQYQGSGPWYRIIGPYVQPNAEGFVNVGPPGTTSPLTDANGNPLDFILLVNGRDDDSDGWIDPGWDGVDNDGKNGIDDIGEWIEQEKWLGSLGGN